MRKYTKKLKECFFSNFFLGGDCEYLWKMEN
jgi:hypothetical protein